MDQRKLVDVIRGLEQRNKKLEAKLQNVVINYRTQMQQKEDEYSMRSHEIMEKTRQKFEQSGTWKRERFLMQQQAAAISDQLAVSENQAAVAQEVAAKYKQKYQDLQSEFENFRRETDTQAEEQSSMHKTRVQQLVREYNLQIQAIQEEHEQFITNFNDLQAKTMREEELKNTMYEEYKNDMRESYKATEENHSILLTSIKQENHAELEAFQTKHVEELERQRSKLSEEYMIEIQKSLEKHQEEVRGLKASFRAESRTYLLKTEEDRETQAATLAAKDIDHENMLKSAIKRLKKEHNDELADAKGKHDALMAELRARCTSLEKEVADLAIRFEGQKEALQDSNQRALSVLSEDHESVLNDLQKEHQSALEHHASGREYEKQGHRKEIEKIHRQHENNLNERYKAQEGVLVSLAAEHARQVEELESEIEKQASTIEMLLERNSAQEVVHFSPVTPISSTSSVTASVLFNDAEESQIAPMGESKVNIEHPLTISDARNMDMTLPFKLLVLVLNLALIGMALHIFLFIDNGVSKQARLTKGISTDDSSYQSYIP